MTQFLRELATEFRDFINRGNVIDLAVAVIMAVAFLPVVNSLVDDVIMQIVARIFSQPDFGSLTINLGQGAQIRYGAFLNAVISFLVVALAVFFIVRTYIRAMNLRRRGESEEEAEGSGPTEIELLTEIRDSLRAR